MTADATAREIPIHVDMRGLWVLLAALFLVVAGTKLTMIAALGSPMPYWDQWDGEAADLYLPYLDGSLTFWHFVETHNGHRIAMTRLLALGLLELAGQWDPVLQMLVNALIHTAVIVWFAAVLAPLVAPERRLFVLAFCALLFALPIGTENIFTGFQSAFYLVIAFSFIAIASFATAPAFSLRWVGGALACILAFLSLSSGAVTSAAGAALAAFQMMAGARARNLREVAGAVFLIVPAAYVVAISANPDSPLQARNLFEFLNALVAMASLPYATVIGVAFVHAPLFWLAWRALKEPPPVSSPVWIAIGLAGWSAAQMTALAFGRANAIMGGRYFDLILFNFPINLVALLMLGGAMSGGGRLDNAVRRYAVAWIFAFVAVTSALGYFSSWRITLERANHAAIQITHVKAYFETGDRSHLDDKPLFHIPYPGPQRLIDLLANPMTRAMLPDEIRPADAPVAEFRQRLALKGGAAETVAQIKDGILLGAPAWLALGLGLFFMSGLSAAIGARKRSETP